MITFVAAIIGSVVAWWYDAKDAWTTFQINNEQAKWERENDPDRLAAEAKLQRDAQFYAERIRRTL